MRIPSDNSVRSWRLLGISSEVITQRLLDALPGMIAWLTLLLCIVGAWISPYLLLSISAVFAFYTAARFSVATLANLRGQWKVRHAEFTDWVERYQRFDGDKLAWSAVHHLVILPNYGETLDLLRRSLSALAHVPEARQMTVILAMEAREPEARQKADQLQAEFERCFAHLFCTFHPDNLPGERRAKSANLNWAARWARRKLVDELGLDREHIVVTPMDADTLWHPRYFSALTYHFCTDPRRTIHFWQAPIRYHANVYQISPLMRLVNAYATGFELAFLTADWWLSMPMSSYSLSLSLLEECGYWQPDVIADEWHTYITAFALTQGQALIQPIFLPFLAQATTGDTMRGAWLNRYRQSLRHAWGSKELGYAVAVTQLVRMPLLRRGQLIARIAHDILLPGAGWILVTFGTQLPFLFDAELRLKILQDPLSMPAYLLLQVAFGLFFVFGLLVWVLDRRVRPSRTTPRRRWESLETLVSVPLLPVMTFLFVALPLLHAQTRLMFADKLIFRVTRKET